MGRPPNCGCCGIGGGGGGGGDACYGVSTNIYAVNQAEAAIIQSDDKTIVAGRVAPSNFLDNDVALVRYNTNGSLDTTFGTNGIVITDIANFTLVSERITSIVVQPDGKIIVAGLTMTITREWLIFLIRYNSNGSIDTTFGINGKITIVPNLPSDVNFGLPDVVLALQADGQILIATNEYVPPPPQGKFGVRLLRIDASGTVNFDNTIFNEVYTFPGAMIISPTNNKILIAGYSSGSSSRDGFFLARYNFDGSLDTSFGSNINNPGGPGGPGIGGGGGNIDDTFGYVFVDFGLSGAGNVLTGAKVCDIIIDNDGKIILGGTIREGLDFRIGLVRFSSDGIIDTSFNNNGKVITSILGNFSSVGGIAKHIDNKIVVGGMVILNNRQVFYIARFNNDGSFDTGFNEDGIITTLICPNDANCTEINIQSDNKIILSGYNDLNFVIIRYNSDGTVDTSFNGV